MRLTKGKDVTPKDDIAEDAEGVKAMERAARKPRKTYTLFEADLKVGDVLHYANNDQATAEVIAPKKVLFEGKEESLSASALTLLKRDGYNWNTCNGWSFWMFENETIAERLARVLSDHSDEE